MAIDPHAKDTASASRDHFLEIDSHNLITISGGKWTTYRRMAEETVDKAIEIGKFKPSKCKTADVKLIGAANWEPAFFFLIAQTYSRERLKEGNKIVIPSSIAQHLSLSYGTRLK